MNNCIGCKDKLTGKYCSGCGRPAITKRIDGHYIMHEIEHVLHFEKGILFTVKELLLRPGKNVKEFLSHDRAKLVKPILFIVITSLIYTLTIHFFHIKDGYISFNDGKNSKTSLIFAWIQNHYGYTNIIMGVFIALWLKLFFKKYGYNIFEILILLCFSIGMGMLILSGFALFEGLTKLSLMQISTVVMIIYYSWAIGQFFDKQKVSSYLMAFGAYILGMITFSFTAILLGFLAGSI